jgi:hypothetical protein
MAAWCMRQRNAIDEVIAGFKGQTRMKAYIPTKKHQWGIKIWKACDSLSGYMWAFLIYTGADSNGSEHDPYKNLPQDDGVPWTVGEKVVLYFAMMMAAGTPWIIFIDNYFTTVRLLLTLLTTMGIYATGTINIWTQMFPVPLVLRYASLKKQARGAYDWVVSEPGLLVLMWNDSAPKAKKKAVSFASTASGPGADQTVKRWVRRSPKPSEITQPNVSKEYNNGGMGGVDTNNRGAAVYKISSKTSKWWWAVFWHIIDSVIHNAWVLMYPDGAGNSRKKQQLTFRVKLVEQLVGDYNGRKLKSRPREDTMGRYDGYMHYIQRKLPPPGVKAKSRCGCGCKKESSFECSKCNVTLTVDCFRSYHTEEA